MKNFLSSKNLAIWPYTVSPYGTCQEIGKAERENSTIDHPDIRGLDTADQWNRRELASLCRRGSTEWSLRRFASRILRTAMYRPAPPIRFISYRRSVLVCTICAVCPTIAPQMNPASSRATAVAATWGGRFAFRRRQYFRFKRFPARSAYFAISGDTIARSVNSFFPCAL